MYRLFTTLVIALIIISFSDVRAIQGIERWECALNLHQGDTGTMSLQRSGDKVDGVISVSRNDTIFKNQLSGSWDNDRIDITRLLNANSNDQMTGAVITVGTKKVKVGGRYSDAYQGVWSADCDLVSSSVATSEKSDDASETGPEPSTSSRVTPNNPTDRDRVKFSAVATHPDGVKSITFFLGDKQIHTCEASQCDFSYGPLSKGDYKWRAEALSSNGAISSKRFSDLSVIADAAREKCSISGSAIGGVAELSSIYTVNLYGPDNDEQLSKSVGFRNGTYAFSGVPKGRYRLSVDTGADKSVLVTPSTTPITCSPSKSVKQDFDFR